MSDECKLLGYVLGTYGGWNGDVEAITFNDFKPAAQVPWIEGADNINIDLINGTVEAYGEGADVLKQWTWKEFIANL